MLKQRLFALASSFALVLGLNASLFVPVASAATTANHNITLNNKTAMSISMTKGAAGVAFGDVTPVTAAESLDAVNLAVQSNASYQVQVKAATANFTSGANNIPVGRLSWKLNGGGSYAAMTITDAQVSTGSKPGTATDIKVDYQLALTYDDAVAESYTTNIVYTVMP